MVVSLQFSRCSSLGLRELTRSFLELILVPLRTTALSVPRCLFHAALLSACIHAGGESIGVELDWGSSSLIYTNKSVEGSSAAGELDRDRVSGGMFWVHFKALLAKRATYGLRDKKSQFFQLIVPTLLFLLGLILLRLRFVGFWCRSLLFVGSGLAWPMRLVPYERDHWYERVRASSV